MGLLARFFKGGLPIVDMMGMKFNKDIKPWFDIYILQSTEEEIVHELGFDEKGQRRELPNMLEIRKKVLKRIEERKQRNGA